jgi:hypothetical protein
MTSVKHGTYLLPRPRDHICKMHAGTLPRSAENLSSKVHSPFKPRRPELNKSNQYSPSETEDVPQHVKPVHKHIPQDVRNVATTTSLQQSLQPTPFCKAKSLKELDVPDVGLRHLADTLVLRWLWRPDFAQRDRPPVFRVREGLST